jgi:hypothetical protein
LSRRSLASRFVPLAIASTVATSTGDTVVVGGQGETIHQEKKAAAGDAVVGREREVPALYGYCVLTIVPTYYVVTNLPGS